MSIQNGGDVPRADLVPLNEDHAEEVLAFFEKENSPNLAVRSLEGQRWSARNGVGWGLRDVNTGSLLGVAGGYPVGARTDLVELGNMLLAEPARTLGIQVIMFRVRLYMVHHRLANRRPITVIDNSTDDGRRSIKNAIRVGFEPSFEDIPEVYEDCRLCPKRRSLRAGQKCCASVLVCPPAKLQEVAQIAAQQRSHDLENAVTGKRLVLTVRGLP
ncbi:MAG: hypothetical protein L6R30_09675 [Thermoanaerobaculia bacterium]|nr:hypothetical protein [Myxococcota bacterium]MCK6682670.1 hypothetical protein [Thermoanaerobaculia bacterium]